MLILLPVGDDAVTRVWSLYEGGQPSHRIRTQPRAHSTDFPRPIYASNWGGRAGQSALLIAVGGDMNVYNLTSWDLTYSRSSTLVLSLWDPVAMSLCDSSYNSTYLRNGAPRSVNCGYCSTRYWYLFTDAALKWSYHMSWILILFCCLRINNKS